MRRSLSLLILVGLVVWLISCGQKPAVVESLPNLPTTTEVNLARVRTVFVDSKGTVYAGYYGPIGGVGTCTKKGCELTSELREIEAVNALYVLADTIWVGADSKVPGKNGLLVINGKTVKDLTDGVTTHNLYSFFPTATILYIGTARGAVFVDRQMVEPLTQIRAVGPERVHAILSTDTKDFWVGTIDKGLIRYQGFTPTRYVAGTQVPGTNVLKSNNIRALAQGLNGAIWVGTDGGGVVRFEHDLWTIFDNQANVWDLKIDKHGRPWTAGPQGVFYLDKNGIWQQPLKLASTSLAFAPANCSCKWLADRVVVGTSQDGIKIVPVPKP